jgi:1-deoxy-D-xylulose 5-phosphate reductoisomerase
LLIEDLTAVAVEAIEQAAAEAAKAATLAAVEREAVLLRDVQYWRFEVDLRQQAIAEAKKAGTKNTVLAAVIGFLGGLIVGVGGTLIIGGR